MRAGRCAAGTPEGPVISCTSDVPVAVNVADAVLPCSVLAAAASKVIWKHSASVPATAIGPRRVPMIAVEVTLVSAVGP